MKTFTVNTGYPLKIKVVVSANESKVVKYINRKQHRKGSDKCTEKEFKTYHGIFCPNKKYGAIIWIRRKPKKAGEHGTLAHEILHAVFDTLRRAGLNEHQPERLHSKRTKILNYE